MWAGPGDSAAPSPTLKAAGHQEALQLLEAEVHAERARYAAAAAARDFDTAVVYTGEAIDMIHSIEPAEAISHRVVAGAEAALARPFD